MSSTEEQMVPPEDLEVYLGGVAGGFVGTALMIVVLYLVDVAYGGRLEVFRVVSSLTGAGGNLLLGFVLFFGAGAVVWPLIYVTVGSYLPGSTHPRKGVLFALILWIGFVLAFSGRYASSTADLAVFLVFSLLAHAVYGFVVGLVARRVSGRYPAV